MQTGPVEPGAALGRRAARWPVPGQRWCPHWAVPRRWWPDAVIITGCVLLTASLLWPSSLVHVDVALRDFGQAHQTTASYWTARALNFLGQGSPLAAICAVLAGWVAWTFRTVRPLLLFAAVYLALAAVLLLKSGLGRAAPRYPDPENPPYVDAANAVLFGADNAASFPSGHAANSAVWYGLAILLIGSALTSRQRLALLAIPPIVLLVCQTYLGFHWFSDIPAGYLLGIEILRLVQRVPWERLPIPDGWDRNCRREPHTRSR